MNKLKILCMMSLFVFFSIGGIAQTKSSNDCRIDEPMKTRSDNFIFEKDTPWQPAGEGVTRQILGYDGNLMMVKVKFEKGAIGALHHHYHTQCTYVASGKFEFTIGGVKKIVSAGDALFKQPDIEHGCVCLEAGVLIDTFSPMRADFLTDKK